MKAHYLINRFIGYALAFFVLFGVGLLGSSTAQAQWRRDRDRTYDRDDQYRRDRDDQYRRDRDDVYRRDRDDVYRRDRYYNNYEVARQQGYSYGLNAGAMDAQRNRRFDPERSSAYKKGTAGYDSRYGNKGQYKQVFRDAFLQGYREGYQQYGYDPYRRNNDRRNNGRWNNGRWVNGVWIPW